MFHEDGYADSMTQHTDTKHVLEITQKIEVLCWIYASNTCVRQVSDMTHLYI